MKLIWTSNSSLAGQIPPTTWLLPLPSHTTTFFTKRLLLKPFHGRDILPELLQSGKGTQRLTLIKDGAHWRAGNEVEQIGIIQQEVVDLPGAVINKVPN